MKKTVFCLSTLVLACSAALAQTTPAVASSPIGKAVQQAVEVNPEVQARFNAFRAAADEVDVAAGAYKPRVDANAEVGRREYRNNATKPYDHQFNRNGVELSVTQLLWDGLATRNEVSRLSHTRLLRYFEFVDTTEQIGLQAAAAYYDVVRYRRLVKLAEDNYVQHKLTAEQVQSRVKAGVGRGVDLEQVVARVALAESNLVTERANLHDVTERYRRIVGALPPVETVAAVSLAQPLPVSAAAAMESAAARSPAVAAAVENLRAAKAAAAARKSAYQPRVEARVRAGGGNNFDGTENQKRDATAEIVLNWNLFNGGADSARERQYANLLTQAGNLRDKACNDTRQTVAIAYNDVRKLKEQLGYLDRNVVSIEKARDAYRQQFDIGQRSLLDLLNAENELYTARRAYAVAEQDLSIAVVRTHAGMGTLVAGLGLKRTDTSDLAPEAADWAAGEDASNLCPLTPTDIAAASQDDLDARARSLAASRLAPAPAAAPAPAGSAAPSSAEIQKRSAGIAVQRLQDWAAAWMSKDVSRYMGFYSSDFKPLKTDKSKWVASRKRLVTKAGAIEVKLENIQTKALTDTKVETSFDQIYRSPDYKDSMHKTLIWDKVGSEWQIVGESNR